MQSCDYQRLDTIVQITMTVYVTFNLASTYRLFAIALHSKVPEEMTRACNVALSDLYFTIINVEGNPSQ